MEEIYIKGLKADDEVWVINSSIRPFLHQGIVVSLVREQIGAEIRHSVKVKLLPNNSIIEFKPDEVFPVEMDADTAMFALDAVYKALVKFFS